MDSRSLLIGLLYICCSYAQVNNIMFMPGSSPANPNAAITTCRKQATAKPIDVTRAGKYADYINEWCSVYEDVLPCLGQTLPNATSASDIYLKLIFNETMATRMSKSLCARFPYIPDLTCVEPNMQKVGQCMNWSVNSAIHQFNGMFETPEPLSEEKKNMSSIYACIIAVATAGCFHKEMETCTIEKRKLVYDYHIMLSGRCREIAGIEETTSPSPITSTPITTITPVSQSAVSTMSPDTSTTQSASGSSEAKDSNGSGKLSTLSTGLIALILLIHKLDITNL